MRTIHLNFLLVGMLAMVILLTSGCVIRHGDFSVLSNKMLRLSEFDLAKGDRVKGVVGKDVQHIIIFIPTGGQPTLEGAIDDALDKGDGDVMTDAVVESWGWYIPYVYGQVGWSVSGDSVKTRRN
jgi:hypothetical protein